jgi:XTP/dITP diphosphohydrolase
VAGGGSGKGFWLTGSSDPCKLDKKSAVRRFFVSVPGKRKEARFALDWSVSGVAGTPMRKLCVKYVVRRVFPLLTLVLATANEGKLAELTSLLHGLPVSIVNVRDVLGEDLAVVESGETFEQNAVRKANAASAATRLLCVADDSGLEVEALGGRPGVRSARFAHERATDAENNAALLRELEDVEEGARSARFRCVLALVSPWQDQVYVVEGRCEGSIARTPRGSGGFGYDPLFLVPEYNGRSMAELSEAEKGEVSHRGRAVRELRKRLIQLINQELNEVERIVDPRPSGMAFGS